jgi:small-conductance mechanosensitive channel
LSIGAAYSSRLIGTEGHEAVLTSLVFGVLRILVIIAGVFLVAEIWSVSYTSVLAGLGIGGLAVALAAQPTLQNMIAGFTLFADSPLSVGDFCRYGDKLGTVEEIGLRSTRIRSRDRTVVSIPNSAFADMQLENFTKRDRILIHATINLRYETTADQLRFVLAELRRLLIAHPKIHPDPARVRFFGFGSHSLDLEVFAYVCTSDYDEYLAIREDVYLRMMELVLKSGTGFAFPSQVNYLTRDHGIDASLTREAEAAVAEWREKSRLPFPDFAPAEIRQHDGRLDYPPKGSSTSLKDHAEDDRI